MAKTLISTPSFTGTPFPSLSRHGLRTLPHRRLISTRVKLSFHELPPIHSFDSSFDFNAIVSRAESLLYTLADASVAVDSASGDAAVQKNGGWFGFVSDAMEVVLKVLKDGLTAVHVPYAYGFAIILLTVLVKIATYPLTKKQTANLSNCPILDRNMTDRDVSDMKNSVRVLDFWDCRLPSMNSEGGYHWRTMASTVPFPTEALLIQGCLPTLATIPVWIGLYQALSNVANEGLLTEGFFWIPSLGGPTTIAARQSGSGISWLIPFVDGHPPLGWHDTAAYLVLPVLLVLSQYVSMELMKPPQTDDPAQKNTLLIFKFLPLMIGYFSLSVPSGLSIYWFTNNVLSTAQQVWLRKLGGAKPVVSENASGIISAGRAKRSGSQPAQPGDRFRKLKDEEKKKLSKALPTDQVQTPASTDASEDGSDKETNAKDEEVLDEVYASNGTKPAPDYSRPKRSKRSKRKRAV
ncbi:hypothetical protein TEA_014915 [Camellia sinensis var. sinensis]|uniref:Membrane insertase YidC/Oxa/ALB C-terminal domain-containing protein n=1 Tax=Camellia sinensis var. sinensis TaxID=542762 RepID=A0A4S4DI02_CAMSN|nr:hypothetical protein TEA_014915 [Camellia sinensis var. sinensis]